jgi:hypothetical protein
MAGLGDHQKAQGQIYEQTCGGVPTGDVGSGTVKPEVPTEHERQDQACSADALIKYLKENAQPPPPIRVELVNASELQKDTVFRIHRDDSGKPESARVHGV